MSDKILITISREFGSEGHEIGKLLATKLGIELCDKDLLYKVAERNGLEVKELASVDETVTKRFLQPYATIGFDYGSINDKLFKLQSSYIREIADRQSCIIVGRLADYILKDNPDCIKVFVYAPFETRVEIIEKKHGISKEAARKLVKKMDAARKEYYSYYSNERWDSRDNKDVFLNRGTLGVEGCVEALYAIVRKKKALPE